LIEDGLAHYIQSSGLAEDHRSPQLTVRHKRAIEVPKDWLDAFCRRNRIAKLSLFGSVIRADFHSSSDVDILVEFEPGAQVGYFAMMAMQQELADLIGRQVDLRTPAELSRYIRERVLAAAEVLHVH
jgi:predicted nucleotidyltransferase